MRATHGVDGWMDGAWGAVGEVMAGPEGLRKHAYMCSCIYVLWWLWVVVGGDRAQELVRRSPRQGRAGPSHSPALSVGVGGMGAHELPRLCVHVCVHRVRAAGCRPTTSWWARARASGGEQRSAAHRACACLHVRAWWSRYLKWQAAAVAPCLAVCMAAA